MKKVFNTKKLISLILIIMLATSIVSPAYAYIDLTTTGNHFKAYPLKANGIQDTSQFITDYSKSYSYCYAYAMGISNATAYANNYLRVSYQQYNDTLYFSPSFTGQLIWKDRTLPSQDPTKAKYASIPLGRDVESKYVTVDMVKDYVLSDVQKLGSTARVVGRKSTNYNPNTVLPSNEFMIAVRVSSQSRWNANHSDWNYHFMRRIDNTVWRHKAGESGPVFQLSNGQTPSTVEWTQYNTFADSNNNIGAKAIYDSYYDSDIIYIAVNENFPVDKLTYSGPTSIVLMANTSYQFPIKPEIQPELAQKGKSITWTSSDSTVAYTPYAGYLVTYNKVGTTVIKAACEGKTITINVTVKKSTGIKGDVNADGDVSIADVTFLQKYLANLVAAAEIDLSVADVTYDGSIDIADVTKIQKYISRLIPSLDY